MRIESVALNYAEALFALGERSGETARYAELVDALAAAITTSPLVAGVLASPRVTKAAKTKLLQDAMAAAPAEFRHYLAALVKRGRQLLLPAIAKAYLDLVDIKLNRVRAGVTVAREPDAELRAEVVKALEAQLGKEVLATYTVDPEILGGVVVRLGDRVLDGSVRRRMVRLRRQLLAGR